MTDSPVPVMSRRLLALLAVLTALAPLSIDIYTPSLPAIQAELASADWLTQAIVTSCLLGIGIGQLVLGPLSDRVGRRPVILAGVAGWTLASVASALATTSVLLVVARGLAGLCGAAGIVVARSMVRDLSHDDVAVATRVGTLSTVTALAPVLAPVAGAAIAAAWGWRADFVVLALLGALIAVVFATTVRESLAPEKRVSGGGVLSTLRAALRHRELLGVALALALLSVGFYAYIATASFVIERELGYPPAVFALVFGTNAAAMFCGNLMFRRFARHHHPSAPLGLGLALATVSGVVLLFAALAGAAAAVLWAASTGFAAGAGLVLPAAHSWGQRLSGSRPAARLDPGQGARRATLVASGAASALTGSAQFLGGVVGSPLTGVIGPTSTHLGVLIVASSAAALLVWAVIRRTIHTSLLPRAADEGPGGLR
ncbi:DHA1 family bicyclomycin/chloramphenicol resistance-like MFS transporter [Promicromonospora sp. AC04]|uniref:Bcr/CflA family efflux MFS transporter n=1 Tax=Promicromonospora sp. AC04 TaxID=2135723 RepID=UPI000D338C28|nr:Bcr/CflA family efflux MFS transporter [Promicromonospora sp. AC04]PUB32292.1 DHA1 family bicyclomycin/chloramphenicol resistance-like MFS transporter [Promicromonospora sp. AC04]